MNTSNHMKNVKNRSMIIARQMGEKTIINIKLKLIGTPNVKYITSFIVPNIGCTNIFVVFSILNNIGKLIINK